MTANKPPRPSHNELDDLSLSTHRPNPPPSRSSPPKPKTTMAPPSPVKPIPGSVTMTPSQMSISLAPVSNDKDISGSLSPRHLTHHKFPSPTRHFPSECFAMGTPHSTLSTLDHLVLYLKLKALKATGHPFYQRKVEEYRKACRGGGGELKVDEVFEYTGDGEGDGEGHGEGDGVHWHWEGPDYIPPKTIAAGLHTSRTTFNFHLQQNLPPADDTRQLVSQPDATRNIALWLSSHAGRSPLLEARFEAWFATHLGVIALREGVKRKEGVRAEWEGCWGVCGRLRRGLRGAYGGLRKGRERLEEMGRGEGERRDSGVELMGGRDVCPDAWRQGERILVSEPLDVIKGCEELTQLKKSLLTSPIGQDLTLPGIDISAEVPLETALKDLNLIPTTPLDTEPTPPQQESLNHLHHLARSAEQKIQQALLDTEFVMHQLRALCKEACEEEVLVKEAWAKTMPDLRKRWWVQMEGLREAARLVGEDGAGEEGVWVGGSPVDSGRGSRRGSRRGEV